MKKIIFYSLLVGSLIISSLTLSFAQVAATIKLDPKNPEPKSTVTLTFQTFSFDANTAMITWKVNGKTVLEGQGKTTLKLRTGSVGETSSVVVKVTTPTGYDVTQSIEISPASVLLLYESPKSYVPLLYGGRSLPGEGALVSVTAFPSIGDEGRLVDPSKLSYSWYINDSLYKDGSGLGKQSTFVRLDYLQNKNTVKVVVRSPYGNSAEKKITVYTHPILPLLYTYDSILGVDFTKLIDKRFESVKDFTIALEPFYVSDEEKKRASYTWYLDGLPTTPLGGRILALQPKENSYGTKMLSIDVYGTDKRLQKANTRAELIFDTRK